MQIFQHFAVQFFKDWHESESRFVAGLSPGNDHAARVDCFGRAAAYFRIARNFRVIEEGLRYERALAALDGITPPITTDNVVESVWDLATAFQSAYGTYAVSAASKILWLRYQSPVIIYDSRADIAIRKLGARLGAGTQPAYYRRYLEAWLMHFDKHESAINSACLEAEGDPLLANTHGLSQQQARSVLDTRWFKERVFDYFLWDLAESPNAAGAAR